MEPTWARLAFKHRVAPAWLFAAFLVGVPSAQAAQAAEEEALDERTESSSSRLDALHEVTKDRERGSSAQPAWPRVERSDGSSRSGPANSGSGSGDDLEADARALEAASAEGAAAGAPSAGALGAETSLARPAEGDTGISFGSYGRVTAGSDLHGSTPRAAQVVAHGNRIVEGSYLELDLYYKLRPRNDIAIRLVTTPALSGDLFHYSGDFNAQIALRNLFAEATFSDRYVVWAGSRMVRGDDMYLLDFWPIDGLNVVGGGAQMKSGRFEGAVALGVNRLLRPFQYQTINVANRLQGAESIVQLDRQRFVGSTNASYQLLRSDSGLGMKVRGVVEIHGLPAGEYKRDDLTYKNLPADFGVAFGGQLGMWGFGERDSHVNLFVRLARGLAAFDELDVPSGLDEHRQSFPGASEFLLGASGNYETGALGVLLGSYIRRFTDADRSSKDEDDYWEGIVDVRPYVGLMDLFQVAVDVSYQQRLPRGPSPTLLEVMNPAVFQVAPMVVLSPNGSGSYARPQVRLVYAAAHLNEGARDLYPEEDIRHDRAWNHFFGLQAEWWFNSTYR
ncbi:MAG: carbohydrate porin [Deltaproteobacteria bacterium]|nr:carbohydrate porin [Deltaproteobacteria bacterium]